MKAIVWVIITLIIMGGIGYMIYSNNSSNPLDSTTKTDSLSENGRVTDTSERILQEIDEAINELE